jgi:DNA-directed RNA polymerase subunit A'
MTNLSVMAGLLGQETVRGSRISRGFKDRSLPHFQKNDLSARARGFVDSSIYGGLEPDEMFYEVMSGREGLMDQSLRTRTSGYMYRRISNALQDLSVEYDRSVRAADGTIVQFTAGEDGIDPQKSDRGELIDE